MSLRNDDEENRPWMRAQRRRLTAKQRGLCFFCRCVMNEIENDPRAASIDHYPRPVHQGGVAQPGNMVAACRTCNSLRQPEVNIRKRQASNLVATSGELPPSSPFEILRDRL